MHYAQYRNKKFVWRLSYSVLSVIKDLIKQIINGAIAVLNVNQCRRHNLHAVRVACATPESGVCGPRRVR